MILRLRSYVAIIAFRHLFTGCLFVVDAHRYQDLASFTSLFKIASPTAWGLAQIALGAVAVLATLRPRFHLVRAALYGSVFMSILWASAFLFSKVEVPSASLLLLALYAALAAKDFIITTTVPYRARPIR